MMQVSCLGLHMPFEILKSLIQITHRVHDMVSITEGVTEVGIWAKVVVINRGDPWQVRTSNRHVSSVARGDTSNGIAQLY